MWIVIGIVVAVAVASYFAGGSAYLGSPKQQHTLATPERGKPVEEPAYDKCANCREIQAWWDSLPWYLKAGYSVYYGAQKGGCAILGC
jgi:hypothetical protein